jgi:hypothetical protein
MTRRILSLLAAAVTTLAFSSCQSPQAVSSGSVGASADYSSGIAGGAGLRSRAPSTMAPCVLPADRKGLATGWGQKVEDKITTTIYERDASKPVGVAKIFYNNAEGARAMAGNDYSLSNSFRDYASGIFRVGMRNHRGAALSAYQSGGNLICVGEEGERYSVEVENLSNHRLEFVVTVDGLNVLNGQKGNFSQRGYILSPGERHEIKGWRTSLNDVASFKFGKVVDCYVNNKTGETANVGVVGAAVFAERGTTPRPYAGTDSYRRLHADPFVAMPQNSEFAKPPSR